MNTREELTNKIEKIIENKPIKNEINNTNNNSIDFDKLNNMNNSIYKLNETIKK